MKNRILSLLNLAIYFCLHLVKMLWRFLGGRAPGIDKFRQNYEAEGVFSLSPQDRRDFHLFSGCIGCGICQLGLRITDRMGLGIADAELLALCLSRSMPALPAARDSWTFTTDLGEKESGCPRQVPLTRILNFIRNGDKRLG